MIVPIRGALIVVLAAMLTGDGGRVTFRGEEFNVNARGSHKTLGLQLSLALEKKEVLVDEPLLVKFSTKNVARKPLFVLESNPDTDYRFDVRDDKGNVVPLTEYGKKILSTAEEVRMVLVKLRPGEETHSEVRAERIVQLNVAGTYYITAKRRVPQASNNLTKLVEISSNTVRVVIAPR